MKNLIIIGIVIISALWASAAYAHVSQNPVNDMMRQMMGQPAFESMEQIEEQMMGAQNHERMEELMDRMLASGLTAEQQREMIGIMQNEQSGPGAQMMMTRMTSGQTALTFDQWGGSGMMGVPFWNLGWVLMIVFWVMAALGVVWVIRHVGRGK